MYVCLLTCCPRCGHTGLIFAAPSADDDGVQSSRDKVSEYALFLGLCDSGVVLDHIVVFNNNLVKIKISWRTSPVDPQRVITCHVGNARR